MTITYPASLHGMNKPGPTTNRDDPGLELDVLVTQLGELVEALQTKLGTGASLPAAGGVLRGTGAGASAFGAIVAADIAAGAITSAAIADGTIATGDVADGAVTSAKIFDGTIATVDIGNLQITTAKLANQAVDASKLALNSVGAAQIAADQVQTIHMLDANVTTAKLAAHAASQSGFINLAGGATVAFGGSLVDIAGAFVDLTVQASGEVLVAASMAISNTNAGAFAYLGLSYDAVAAAVETPTVFPLINAQIIVSTVCRFTGLAAGTRRFKAQWRGSVAGTTALYGLQMTALELKR